MEEKKSTNVYSVKKTPTQKNTEQQGSVLDDLPPKVAFISGVVVSVAVLSVVALITMGMIFFGRDDDSSSTTKKTVQNTDTTAVVAPSAAPSKPTPSGRVNMDTLTNVRGEGSITLVEYSDTECPFCKRFHPSMQQIIEEYDGKVAWGYKHFPLTSLHPKAPREAEATECAAEQGKFWEYVDLMFEKTPSNNKLEDSELFTMADEVGLERAKFDDCLATGKYKDKVEADAAEAVKLGGTGTPYTVIIDAEGEVLDTISGALPIETLQTAVEQYIN